MNVKEIISKLENANPNAPVRIKTHDLGCERLGKVRMNDPSSVEITDAGVIIHGIVAPLPHECVSDFQKEILSIINNGISPGGIFFEKIKAIIKEK